MAELFPSFAKGPLPLAACCYEKEWMTLAVTILTAFGSSGPASCFVKKWTDFAVIYECNTVSRMK